MVFIGKISSIFSMAENSTRGGWIERGFEAWFIPLGYEVAQQCALFQTSEVLLKYIKHKPLTGFESWISNV